MGTQPSGPCNGNITNLGVAAPEEEFPSEMHLYAAMIKPYCDKEEESLVVVVYITT